MKKGWTTTKLMAIGALAALYVILSAPGAVLAGITGNSMSAAIVNIVVIGIMYPLVALIIKRPGAVTLWAVIIGFLFIPFPLAGPPGFLLKVVYMGFWGILADLTYLVFKNSDKLTAIAIGIIQIGPGAPLAVLVFKLLGASQLADQVAAFSSFVFVLAGAILGAILGYLAYLLYKKVENSLVIKRIQA